MDVIWSTGSKLQKNLPAKLNLFIKTGHHEICCILQFGYKKREQRFPLRRHAGDRQEEDHGFGTLTPEDAPPPPKPPAKDFIKRNKERLAAQTKKKDQNSTVTLTQEQLNAILKSVGKITGGKENALKISIGEKGTC